MAINLGSPCVPAELVVRYSGIYAANKRPKFSTIVDAA